MNKTAVVYSPVYLQHKTGLYHPETPARLRIIFRELNKSGIIVNNNIRIIEPETVNLNKLEQIHNLKSFRKI